MEQDVCALLLSVDNHVDQILFEERCARENFLAEVQRQRPTRTTTGSTVASASSTQVTAADAEEQHVEGRVGRLAGVPPLVALKEEEQEEEEKEEEEVEHSPFSNIAALFGMSKETMPAMLSLDGCLEM